MMRIVLAGLLMSALPPLAASADEIDETVEVQPGGVLHVDLDVGSLAVQSHDADRVRVEARAHGWGAWNVEFDLWRDGNDVYLTGDSGGWASWLLWPFGGPRVSVRAWVPRDYSLAARTAGGRIDLADLGGRISAETSGGPVALRKAKGEVDLRTTGGAVEVSNVDGRLSAETSGGSVTIADVSGDVWTRTSGGRIKVARACGEVDAATSGGNIFVSFSTGPAGSLETSGGSIEVRLPDGAGTDLEARTSGGRVEVAPRLALRGETRDPRHVVGTLNGGGAPLRLRTSGGNIEVGSL